MEWKTKIWSWGYLATLRGCSSPSTFLAVIMYVGQERVAVFASTPQTTQCTNPFLFSMDRDQAQKLHSQPILVESDLMPTSTLYARLICSSY